MQAAGEFMSKLLHHRRRRRFDIKLTHEQVGMKSDVDSKNADWPTYVIIRVHVADVSIMNVCARQGFEYRLPPRIIRRQAEFDCSTAAFIFVSLTVALVLSFRT